MIELLVATSIISLVMAAAGTLFVSSRNYMEDQILSIETEQGLRATLESMARDLRLGGACLPTEGDFVSLSGTDSASADQIVTRTGLVRPNLSCVKTALQSNLAQTDTQLSVGSVSGFTVGMRAYIQSSNGTGDTFTITGINTSQNKLITNAAWSQAYPKTSGVYAIDERTYAIDTSNPQLPVLTIAVNGGAPIPFASGVENLTIKYELERNCPAVPPGPWSQSSNCDIVDAPAPGSSDWRLVNQIYLTVTVRSRTTRRNGQYFRATGTISAKPRNLFPG